MSEIQYNLAINDAKRNLAVVQRELSEAIVERDKVLNEISAQRKASTLVVKDVEVKENKKYSIIEQLVIMEETLKKSSIDFYKTTDKENMYIKSLERSIQEKKAQEQQFLYKKEDLEKLEKTLSNKQLEFKRLQQEMIDVSENIEKLHKTQENREIAITNKEIELKQLENSILDERAFLNKKKDSLDLKEKRLLKYKESLLKK